MNENFSIFILTHGRPKSVYTYNTLKKQGYTGKIYIVIDNEDKTEKGYIELFGDSVRIFDKKEIAKTFDEGDNFGERRTIIYARNACFEIAKKEGIEYFLELDDDYTSIRFGQFETGLSDNKKIDNLDLLFSNTIKYYKSINSKSIAFAQGGDFLGGKNGCSVRNPRFRKCMNSFFCSTERPFRFVGRINEDVNTYTRLASTGDLFLSIIAARIEQKQTQKTAGGMTDVYLLSGTYVKSFYTVMYSPSCTRIAMMHSSHPRLHHKISWNYAVPVIVREEWRKNATR